MGGVVEVVKNGAVLWSKTFEERLIYEADRLPAGETVGGERYTEPMSEQVSGAHTARCVLGVTSMVGILKHQVGLPMWVTELEPVASGTRGSMIVLGAAFEVTGREYSRP